MAELIKNRVLLFVINEDWFFWTHRLSLARAARDNGYKVIIAARFSKYKELLTKEGFLTYSINIDRNNKNPLKEIYSVYELYKLYKLLKPNIIHHTTFKPVLYGTLASIFAKQSNIINGLPGLGYIFSSKTLKTKFIRFAILKLYKFLSS